jgi:uncharacterized protein (TIGR02246 family)
MRRAFRLLLALPLAIPLAACAPTKAEPTDTASAKVDLAAEEQAIKDLNARWVRMIAAKDTAGIYELYASDALYMAPNAQALGGRPGVAKAWSGFYAMKGSSLSFRPTKVVVAQAGDLAYDVGTFTFGMDGPRGRIEDKGKYLTVWKKQDGAWRIAAEMYNSDLPAK